MCVQLYVDALDQYLYYFEQNVEAVSVCPLTLPFTPLMLPLLPPGNAKIHQQSR
jgi:hypothetical protein